MAGIVEQHRGEQRFPRGRELVFTVGQETGPSGCREVVPSRTVGGRRISVKIFKRHQGGADGVQVALTGEQVSYGGHYLDSKLRGLEAMVVPKGTSQSIGVS